MKTLRNAFLLLVLTVHCHGAILEKDWEGASPENEFTGGVMAGMGVLDGTVGFSILGTFAKKVVPRGFADMNNQVFLEAQMGPFFVTGGSALQYSAHLRWDFHKDLDWSFYGIGGVGGIVTGTSLASRALFYPRFGVGAFWHLGERMSLRAELSHEFMGAGVSIPF